ncbi:hypothetical protein SAMN04487785_102376 [Dyella jiangningensis]|uniref:hypothetical protein n=1 Tax=Dyella sp. AtDHG13 TaxID=1938897 RepID=UPI0008888124|nr:hypothetical protein [Dyella sp. AtDHG13]PXV60648.1 hypothetical protein BDW41_102375 [Dyella sp. AtDHG13]SDJ53698.1 hypothetical protein SAMN04487785_102376 [Dyella jiangningensis]
MSGQPLDHWLATLPGSVCFASVNMRIDGTWKVNLMPKGDGLNVIPIYSQPYRTREKAMAHVERWAHYHWRKVPPAVPKPRMMDR